MEDKNSWKRERESQKVSMCLHCSIVDERFMNGKLSFSKFRLSL